MAAEGVFVNNKAGSRERGAVASDLVAEGMPVISRSVRDRYNILAKKWQLRVREEESESGGGDEEMTEVEKLLEEWVVMERESEMKKGQRDEEKK